MQEFVPLLNARRSSSNALEGSLARAEGILRRDLQRPRYSSYIVATAFRVGKNGAAIVKSLA
jgi:hypothetical protein